MVAAEGDEMQVARLLKSFESPRHGVRLQRKSAEHCDGWPSPPTSPPCLSKNGKDKGGAPSWFHREFCVTAPEVSACAYNSSILSRYRSSTTLRRNFILAVKVPLSAENSSAINNTFLSCSKRARF